MNFRIGLLALGLALFVSVPSTFAGILVYQSQLTGAAESPPVDSPGTGFTTLTYDTTAQTMRLEVSFSGLLGNTTVAHIHAATRLPGVGTAGVATRTPSFEGFPAGVTFGSYDRLFDMTLATSWNASYVNANGGIPGAQVALVAALNAGKAYLNIHTSRFSGGEIRGFLQAVPEPSTIGLALFGAAGLVIVRRRRAGK